MKRLNLLPAATYRRGVLTIVDQTVLPERVRRIRLRSAAEVAEAIGRLAIRGAPWLGVAGAYGLAVEAWRLGDRELGPGLRRAARLLGGARPTAVNLRWAVDRVSRATAGYGSQKGGRGLREAVEAEAKRICQEEKERSRAMARHGAGLVPKGAVVLTICNTGALAGPGMGTALGVVFQAQLDGRRPRVFVCETRPLLQGARLTMLELERAGVPATLIADSAAASVVERCDLVLAGADRIAANGDTANKVGTRMLAVLARHAVRPFYVVAPTSTIDPLARSGKDVRVEERDGGEVLGFRGCRAAPSGARAFNPAFDVTPGGLVSAFVTEQGVVRPPFVKGVVR